MLQVFLACLLRLGILGEIVVAVGKAEPALADVGDLRAGIVQVGRRAKSKQRGYAQRVQVGHGFNQLVFVGDSRDPVQLRLERRGALGVHPGLVHAGLVHVADLLHDRSALGIVGRCLLQYLTQDLAVVLGQLVEASPARLIGRNGVVLAPVAAGVLVEVLAGVRGLVHGAEVKGLGPGDGGVTCRCGRRCSGALGCRRGYRLLFGRGAALRDRCQRQRPQENNG